MWVTAEPQAVHTCVGGAVIHHALAPLAGLSVPNFAKNGNARRTTDSLARKNQSQSTGFLRLDASKPLLHAALRRSASLRAGRASFVGGPSSLRETNPSANCAAIVCDFCGLLLSECPCTVHSRRGLSRLRRTAGCAPTSPSGRWRP